MPVVSRGGGLRRRGGRGGEDTLLLGRVRPIAHIDDLEADVIGAPARPRLYPAAGRRDAAVRPPTKTRFGLARRKFAPSTYPFGQVLLSMSPRDRRHRRRNINAPSELRSSPATSIATVKPALTATDLIRQP
jgi:hypothetical protein